MIRRVVVVYRHCTSCIQVTTHCLPYSELGKDHTGEDEPGCDRCRSKMRTKRWVEERDHPDYGPSIVLTFSENPREKKNGTWYINGNRVSYRCWFCGWLSWIHKYHIDPCGHTMIRDLDDGVRCFQCPNCANDRGLYFEGWDKVVKEGGG